ncbi:MAG TPA: FtsX-like permease family protein [Cyclobacteriaceae bacterium]
MSYFIIFIAWVNYINLSTARGVDRAKEVGLRKVVGSAKGQLVFQFLMESFIINFLGALLAILLSEILLGYFNHLVNKDILIHIWDSTLFLQTVIFSFVIGSLISGIYPAFLLSGYKPITVLKGKYRNSKTGILLRKGLVITQFSISLMLITATIIVIYQVRYMLEKDKGINIEQTIGLQLPITNDEETVGLLESLRTFEANLENHNSILGTALVTNLPGGGSSDIASFSGGARLLGKTETTEGTYYMTGINDKVVLLLEIDMLHGRNFSRDIKSDSSSVLVNEAFIKKIGLKPSDDLIEEKILFGKNENNENNKFKLIGIIKNISRTKLKQSIEPTAYFAYFDPEFMVVKINESDMQRSLSYLESQWNKFFPNSALNYVFLDERYARLYEEENQFGQVFGTFSIFAIIISILGLYGLSSFMAAQRTKEVGIRKVLGSRIIDIIALFYKDFAVLIAIGAFIGTPMVYLFMNQWLNNYAYHISFPWWAISIALVMIILLAFITIGYQTYKVAGLDPAKTLKYE